MNQWSHGYRNKGDINSIKPRPPQKFEKPAVVVIGNLTVVFIRDATVVTMKWQRDGKTYKMRLKPFSHNWKKAVLEARRAIMQRNRN